MYKAENPQDKIGERMFGILRPHDVQFATLQQCLVCGCMYHINMGYMLETVNTVLRASGQPTASSTGSLVEKTL